MTVEEAASAVVFWLGRYPIKIAPHVFGQEIEPCHFRISIAQVLPEPKQRVFEMAPLDVPDCWQVKELEAA